jgi:hypothetical protein
MFVVLHVESRLHVVDQLGLRNLKISKWLGFFEVIQDLQIFSISGPFLYSSDIIDLIRGFTKIEIAFNPGCFKNR